MPRGGIFAGTPCLRRAVIAVGAGASSLRFDHLAILASLATSFSICLSKLLRACFRFAARLHPPEEALEFAATTTTNAFFSRALGKASRAQQPHKTRRLIRPSPPTRDAPPHSQTPPLHLESQQDPTATQDAPPHFTPPLGHAALRAANGILAPY